MKYNCVQASLSRIFQHLGKCTARHPILFMLTPVIISGVFMTGVFRMTTEKDITSLFVPSHGRAKSDRAAIDELFPMNFSVNFDFGRLTRLNGFGTVLITSKDGGSVLREHIFADLIELDRLIRSITVNDGKTSANYSSVCARRKGICFRNEILNLEKNLTAIREKKQFIKYPIDLDPKTYSFHFYAKGLGGVTTDEEGRILSAKAVRLYYYLYSDKGICLEWERAFLHTLTHAQFDNLTISWFASESMANEINRITELSLPLLSVSVALMLTFAICTCLSSDCVRSKPWLGVTGCLSSGLAVAAAFGFVMHCGIQYIDINIAVPFLMLGIGMDDTFVLLAAWRRSNPKDSVEDRMGASYSEAAVSITITSVTNFVSFLIGLTTPFRAVRIFCLYTAVAILFTYIYQITFFGGCMALSGYREERKLHPFTCLPVLSKYKSEKKNCLFRWFCTGGDDDDVTEMQSNFLMDFFKYKLGSALSYIPIKIAVLIAFSVYLGFGLWTSTMVEEGLDYRNLYPYDSHAVVFSDLNYGYFTEYPHRIQVVINITLDYSNPNVQKQIEELTQKFENSPYIANSNLTESWLRYYLKFLNDSRTQYMLRGFDLTDKQEFIDALEFVFLKFKPAERFRDDIIFNENHTEIIASRFLIQSENVRTAQQEKSMLLELRRIADESKFPVTVYNMWFITFEPMLMVKETSLQAICVAAIVMMIIFLIFIPNVTCAICVAFSIISIEIGVYGYMSAWGVKLNPISMINLIMCIGFSVDFSTHISYSYITSTEKTGNERMRSALYAAGMPIFQGSASTILGVAVLCFAPSHIFVVFSKTVFLVMFFAAMHGLVLLPVLLSFRESCYSKKRRAASSKKKREYEQKTEEIEELSGLKQNKDESEGDSDEESGYNGDNTRESKESLQRRLQNNSDKI
ncbi:patched domain-containing protein 3-like [Centruroides sculpturatus]|uniref:patched domain-containing protein 3-like n=1 Tax=Centruroides sculpturatus TaxID=218467 RepID=UPI000C6EA914|nr:patched domain-containing protein 3-like [Centruroides sculpturatus]